MSRRPPYEPIGFAKELEKSGNYVSDNSLLYEWTGSHWQAIDDDMAIRMALKWIAVGHHGTINEANAKSAYRTALAWLPIIGEQVEATVIPVRNGYLSFDHGLALTPHDKSMGLRHVLSCDFEPTAPAPKEFNAFLERILPDAEVRGRVQEYIGYTLLPDTRFQRAQIWLGSGANGKGTLANVVQALHKRTAAVQLDKLDGFYMANTIGASLIYCDEAPQRGINEQAMKSLIAGELVQIDRKYLSHVSTRITGKWLILSNHIPAVSDQSAGFWRRFDIVPFSAEIPEHERDPMLAKRVITHELTGVLNWAVEGLVRLLARGRFDVSMPAAISHAVQSARVKTNSVQAWAQDVGVEFTTVADAPKSDVYNNYSIWCKANGMSQVSSLKFWERFTETVGGWVEGRKFTKDGSRIRTCNVRL